MPDNDTRNKIQDIISGTHITWQEDHCTAARNFLCRSFSASTTVKRDFEDRLVVKKKQAEALREFIDQHQLWVERPSHKNQLLTIGGEAEIYINVADGLVLKLNDAVYYPTWLDFFNSILLHNLFFGATIYELVGFTMREYDLQALLTQVFIISDAPVDLSLVKEFLEFNGFKNTRRNDYYNKELGLILEDIHDENVIMNSGIMFFIDTVFYIDLEHR
jgi:hypothetical protein